MSPVQYLDRIGFLGPDVLATHVTYVNDADLDALARSGRTSCTAPIARPRKASPARSGNSWRAA